MSSEDPKITKDSIDGATEIIKEMLRSPAAEKFFGRFGREAPIQRLLNAHNEIARHLSEFENKSKGEALDKFIDRPLSC